MMIVKQEKIVIMAYAKGHKMHATRITNALAKKNALMAFVKQVAKVTTNAAAAENV